MIVFNTLICCFVDDFTTFSILYFSKCLEMKCCFINVYQMKYHFTTFSI